MRDGECRDLGGMDQTQEGPSHALRRGPEEGSNLPTATQHANSIYWTRTQVPALLRCSFHADGLCSLSLSQPILSSGEFPVPSQPPPWEVGGEPPRPLTQHQFWLQKEGLWCCPAGESVGLRWGKGSPEASPGRSPYPGAAACSVWL